MPNTAALRWLSAFMLGSASNRPTERVGAPSGTSSRRIELARRPVARFHVAPEFAIGSLGCGAGVGVRASSHASEGTVGHGDHP